MKNKIFRTMLSLVLVAVIAIGGTFAYLQASDTPVVNKFDLADVKVDIQEGTTVSTKDPKIYNPDSKSPVYVRARVVVDIPGAPDLADEILAQVVMNDEAAQVEGAPYWMDGGDGFWYYTAILQPGTTTEELFTDVTIQNVAIPENVTSFDLSVYQESILAPGTGSWSLTNAKAAFAAKG